MGHCSRPARSTTHCSAARLACIVAALTLALCATAAVAANDSLRPVAPVDAGRSLAQMRVAHDIVYAEAEGWPQSLATLDLYYRPSGESQQRSVIVFIHGGGWDDGDKSFIGNDRNRIVPEHYTAEGYVFAALNFRLAHSRSPKATIADMAADISAAIDWLHRHVGTYGGRPDQFVLWGYSSGAHLAALLATDRGYLSRYGDPAKLLAGVIAMDVPHYDVPVSIEALQRQERSEYDEKRLRWLYRMFGETRDEQQRFSPAAHVDSKTKGTAFLLVSGGHNRGRHEGSSYAMTTRFQERLKAAGVDVRVAYFPEYGHTELIRSSIVAPVAPVIASFLTSLSHGGSGVH